MPSEPSKELIERARKLRPAIFDGLNALFTADQWDVIERGMAYFADLQRAAIAQECALTSGSYQLPKYSWNPGSCCGDAHNELMTAMGHLKALGFVEERTEKPDCVEILWRNVHAPTAEQKDEAARQINQLQCAQTEAIAEQTGLAMVHTTLSVEQVRAILDGVFGGESEQRTRTTMA